MAGRGCTRAQNEKPFCARTPPRENFHGARPARWRRARHGPAMHPTPPLTAQCTGCPSSTLTSRFPFAKSCTGCAALASGQVRRQRGLSQCGSAWTSATSPFIYRAWRAGKPCIPHPPAARPSPLCDITFSARIRPDPQPASSPSDPRANPRLPWPSSSP